MPDSPDGSLSSLHLVHLFSLPSVSKIDSIVDSIQKTLAPTPLPAGAIHYANLIQAVAAFGQSWGMQVPQVHQQQFGEW
jgi:hypothetical protein